MASQLTLFGYSTVNIKSTRRAFGFFLPVEYSVMYMCYQRGVAVLGVWSILPFIIKRMNYWVLSAYFLAVLEISVSAY